MQWSVGQLAGAGVLSVRKFPFLEVSPCRVAREFFGDLGRKIRGGDTGRGDRVVGSQPARSCFDGHNASRNAAADVLGGLRPEVAVESLLATGEALPVMLFPERLETKGSRRHETEFKAR